MQTAYERAPTPRRPKRWGALLAACLTSFCPVLGAREALSLPTIFSDHMVLQRGQSVPIWGHGPAGSTVVVQFAGQKKQVTVAATGAWRLDLDPLTANAKGEVLEVTDTDGQDTQSTRFRDVLVGEVWFCAGQSNMELPLKGSPRYPVKNSAAEIRSADHPLLRLYLTPRGYASAPGPCQPAVWKVCTPQSAAAYSAVAYFFGKRLLTDLKVPVGLIASSWGATSIDAWTAACGYENLASLSKYKAIADHMPRMEKAKDHAELRKFVAIPTSLFNGMVYGHIPYAIKGVIWYQGENDHREGMLYVDKTKALLAGWRKLWGIDFPFYFVQIAPFAYGKGGSEDPALLPEFWEAEARITQTIPGTWMAVINDATTLHCIHPPDKEVPGNRLALLTEAHTYGMNVISSGPTVRSVERQGDALEVVFDHAQGLTTRDGKAPDWFEIAGADGVFKPADARIAGDRVILTAGGIATPVSVRFAWNKIATPNLENGAGWPTAPFRSRIP